MVLIVSCDSDNNSEQKITSDKIYHSLPTILNLGDISDLKVYTIDSCEYVGKLRGLKGDVLTHKGNCKFCKNRNK